MTSLMLVRLTVSFLLIGQTTRFTNLASKVRNRTRAEAEMQQLYGYVVVEYTNASAGYRKTLHVSQVIGYCSSPQRDGYREIEKAAVSEANVLESNGQFVRAGVRMVSFHGGSSSRATAQQGVDLYKNTFGAARFESGLDTIYYPANVCAW